MIAVRLPNDPSSDTLVLAWYQMAEGTTCLIQVSGEAYTVSCCLSIQRLCKDENRQTVVRKYRDFKKELVFYNDLHSRPY